MEDRSELSIRGDMGQTHCGSLKEGPQRSNKSQCLTRRPVE